jgi:hypothetical protein
MKVVVYRGLGRQRGLPEGSPKGLASLLVNRIKSMPSGRRGRRGTHPTGYKPVFMWCARCSDRNLAIWWMKYLAMAQIPDKPSWIQATLRIVGHGMCPSLSLTWLEQALRPVQARSLKPPFLQPRSILLINYLTCIVSDARGERGMPPGREGEGWGTRGRRAGGETA